ncbi:MAG TPA: ABC transporter permease [Candidatus Blautia gallistercoris]|uniref:ABC transporter permease n=1 Tax=Candidatus Blautia gallistercoris TaxID=2838490 RepID=A0A9D1WJM3_9FIRM|nr:ABC transporter permease [Candidatus Blautia gallistercoris]
MWNILKGEGRKMRRCQILLVGIVALALCPVVQYGTQLIVNPEIRDPNYNFVSLFANVIWGNTQIFLPLSLVMIGGWLIDRENTNDTMKNLLAVPVSYPKLLGGKLIVTICLSLLFGIYSAAITVLTGAVAGLEGLSAFVLLQQSVQVVTAAFNTCLVCMPMILIFGQIRGAYLGGSLLTFFLGYCILFFKSGFLLSAYPFSAALILAGFDMQAYNGATQSPSIFLALAGIAATLVLTMVILLFSHPSRKAGNKKKAGKKRGQRRHHSGK